jgi:hypothetical protein
MAWHESSISSTMITENGAAASGHVVASGAGHGVVIPVPIAKMSNPPSGADGPGTPGVQTVMAPSRLAAPASERMTNEISERASCQ